MWFAVLIALAIGLTVGVAVGRGGRRPDVAPPATTRSVGSGSEDDPVASTLREAANHLALGIVVADASGDIVYRNHAATALGGTHVGVIIDDHVEAVLAAARSGVPNQKRVELHGPPRVDLQLVAEPMPNGAAVATIEDVSERVRLDAMRTDFVANISHELKTPVGAIAVLAEALVDEPDSEVVRRVSGRLVDESHRAVSTIDDLLELSRIESDQRADEVVDLHEVVRAAIARGRGADEGNGVDVTAVEPPEPIHVRGDRRQIVSALGNLVENAVKYSDPGGLVQVRCRVDERVVEVLVADQGHGIPPRDLDRIFERFYRVDRARSRATGGTGLGLSIVRHVAHAHGGQVDVSSQEGEGSTFAFRLPASLVVDDEQLAERSDVVGTAGGNEDGGHATVRREDRSP